MRKTGNRRNWKKAAPVLLAAALWAETTFGTVYAAMPTAGLAQTADSGDSTGSGLKESPAEGETPVPAEEETVPGQTETPEEGEKPAPGEGEKPDPGDGSLSGEEEPDSGDGSLPGEEEPDPGDGSLPGEEKPDPGDGSLPGEEETPVEEPGSDSTEETPEETVSENDLTGEEDVFEESDEEVADALGEPPLMTEAAGGYAAYSHNGISPLAEGIRRQTPGVADIIARYKAYPWSLDIANDYSVQPSVKNPYQAGHLSDSSLENALNLLNFIRYVAGIPADVTLSEDYTEKAQAGALLNRVNGKLDHKPTQPEGFPDELYKTGYTGCKDSNIATGHGNIAGVLLNGWMYEGDSKSINQMGQRRWVLNPAMTQTGFGAVGGYSAMYVLDSKGSSVTDYVAWPAQNMPIELMNGSGTPWTISLGSDYEKANFQNVSVTLKDVTNNKSWSFSGSNAKGVFKVNVEYYGMPNCIIFRPTNITYHKDSQFQVTVSGIKLKDGESGKDTTISYNVDFFSLEEEPEEVQAVVLNREELHLLKGVEGKQEETLLATVKPGNAADKKLIWKSKDETVATVDEMGKVTAVGVGTTVISVKAANSVEAVCTVRVSDYSLHSEDKGFSAGDENGKKAYALSFDLTMDGEAKKLAVMDGDSAGTESAVTDTVRWFSENESVAAVDADGNVMPLRVGETFVWAEVAGGLAVLECRVTVEDSELPQIEMREQACTLTIKRDAAGNLHRDSRQLRLYFTPTDSKWVNQGENFVKWTSDHPETAAFAVQQPDQTQRILPETISGNSVTVTAVGEGGNAGAATITATIVDAEGEPVESDGNTAAASCTVTVQAEAGLLEEDIPIPIALTNEQTTLKDVPLPDGWSWKEPDTALAQFAGRKTKKFAACYKPAGAGEHILPAERMLEVCFLTVEKISLGLRTEEGEETGDTSLTAGQKMECYVNYSFADALEQLENSGDYKDNTWYKNQKEKILKEIGQKITWSSSKPDVVSADSDTLTARNADRVNLTAKSAGSATVKASLKIGTKTFNGSVKLAVKEPGGTLTVKGVEHFTPIVGESESAAGRMIEKYAGQLNDFRTEKPNQANSKITLLLPGATKVAARSGNAKVVAVKSSAAEGEGFAVSLIVKAAGTAELTLTGNDAAKTEKTIRLVVGDAKPGLSDESVTLNVLHTTGTAVSLYPAKSPDGTVYKITDAVMASDEKSANFTLTKGEATDNRADYIIKAKSGTNVGTYKVNLRAKVRAEGGETVYDCPLTVKVVSKNPVYKVKQARKLNLFYKNDESLLQIDTDETIKSLVCTGLADYSVVKKDGGYYVKAENGATVKSVKKGKLQISFAGWQGTYTVSFTVNVENRTPKITWDTNKVTLYPGAGITSMRVGVKNPEVVSWASVKAEKSSGKAKGNYTVEVDRETGSLILIGKNLNQTDNFKMQIFLSDSGNWTEKVSYTLQVKVNMGQPAIALESKTLQLNADAAYRGYDAASTAVKWKEGGSLTADQSVRVSVYCDARDEKAKALVRDGRVIFSVTKESGAYQIGARLNNKEVNAGTYKYIVQASKNGQIWKTPLTLKVVNTAPEKAVKLTAKGSIDVLDRDGSFMTLTPALKAVNGTFVTAQDGSAAGGRAVQLKGRDAHLFRAVWSADGKTIELRAKRNETLVTKYQYTVTPILVLRNINGETEEISVSAVKFKLKQGSVKVSALPKTALMYSGAYNSVEIDMDTVLKGAAAPEIERVTLEGNTDTFTYVYNKDGKGTLTMTDTGRAVKGKNYSLQLRVWLKEQADNVKPVTVRYQVKVK